MDEGFFDCFEATKGTRGEVKATVLIVKSSLLMEVRITIEGMVKATCDRCLGEVNLPVSGVMNLYVKQNGREEGNEDDYIILSPEDDYLDVSSYLYETYMLNYPMRVVHPEGECDEDMQEVLHDAITVTAIAKCSNCGAAVQYHTVCPECGYYRGKLAIEKAVVA